MHKPEDLARLNRHVLLSSLASLGVGLIGLLGLVFYIKPSWVGVDLESQGMYPGEIVWPVAGIILTCAGFTFLFISIHWSSQLKKTVFHTRPVKMVVKVEARTDMDNTTYYAIISQRSADTGGTPVWRAHIWVHPPKIKEDVGKEFEGKVFLQPETRLPVAIEYSRGILWVISGNGAVKRLTVPVL